MQDIVDYYTALAGKVREEMPDLHMLLLLYDTPCWKDARRDAVRFLSSRHGDAADDIVDNMMSLTGPEGSVSMQYRTVIEHEGERTIVFQVNLDQARSLKNPDYALNAKGIIAHEIAHVVGEHSGIYPTGWDSCQEETFADIFSCAVMANEGHGHYGEDVAHYRLHSHVNAEAFAVSSTIHGFPAMAGEERLLVQSYAQREKGAFSIRELKDTVQKLVGDNMPLLLEWQKFANAVMDLQEAGHETGDILHLARKAGSSFVDLVEMHTPFRAAAALSKDFQGNPFKFGHCSDAPPEKILHANALMSQDRTPESGYAVVHDKTVVSPPPVLKR